MDKVVLITGASSGIGKAIGAYLHERGLRVYGTSRNPSKIQSSVPFRLLALDVTQIDTIEKALSEVIQAEGRIDVLVNNAGMGITGPLEETPAAAVLKVYDTNVFGPMEMIRAVLPYMRKQQGGLVINITSIAGYMGLPFRGVYSATKGSMELLTEAYRMELKPFGIAMTSVAPGDFATNIAAGRYHAPVIKGSPYEKVYHDTLEMMNAHVDRGGDPKVMAEAIYRIIRNPNPKGHYRVGSFLQKFSVALKRILPDWMYERMLMRHYKLK